MQLLARWLGEDLNADKGTDTWRLQYGDLARWNENEGGSRMGGQLSFDIGFGDHIGDFDIEGEWVKGVGWVDIRPKRKFLTHWIAIMVGRWGISFSWRGREITGTDWDIPRWKLDKDGKLLPDWAE